MGGARRGEWDVGCLGLVWWQTSRHASPLPVNTTQANPAVTIPCSRGASFVPSQNQSHCQYALPILLATVCTRFYRMCVGAKLPVVPNLALRQYASSHQISLITFHVFLFHLFCNILSQAVEYIDLLQTLNPNGLILNPKSLIKSY